MSELRFGLSAYSRKRGDLPELPVVNMFAEKADTEPGGVVLQSRPGLVAAEITHGTAPVEGVYRRNGVLGDSLFAVSGGRLWRDGVNLGVIDGTGAVGFAGNEIGLVVTAGESAWFYNGSGLSLVVFPDGADVLAVAEVAGRFVFVRDASQKFYWTETLERALAPDGTLLVDGLDFASAENEPDALLDIVVLQDVLVLFGAGTTEFWPKTGDPELPFRPTEGRVFEKGIRATGAAVVYDNTVAWVGDTGLVYVGGNVPTVISDDGIDERVAASTSFRLFAFFFEGHEFLAVRLSQGTWLRDAKTGQWCEFRSHGLENWIAGCVAGDVFGSATDGRTLRFGTTYSDLGGVLERRFRAGQAVNGGSFSVDNLRLRTNPGQTPTLTGSYSDAVVEMRTSRDAGQTWSDWRSTALGRQGRYRERVEWRALGMFDAPGILVDVRVTDPVPFRASAVSVNEPGGGRSR